MPNDKKRTIDDEIDHILEKLGTMDVDSAKYASTVNNLEGLCKAKAIKSEHSVSPDTVVVAATNILGILLILNYEKLNVLTSKTLGLLLRGRI